MTLISVLQAANATAALPSTANMPSTNDLLIDLLVFIMATFLGVGLIRGVTRLLHTPLMALTNAISSVSMIAALIVMSESSNTTILILTTVGVALASTNVISGFLLVERINRLFRKKPAPKKEGQAK
ncbi:MAG: NAD(P) transhydrogenase subunit alpha [Nitrososphaerota archaeon]|nr:NAD(P) transhydrogenase subunit alpha [Nitrososphaerota archaeon]MDG6967336.1 NAD(P) transhydrogenase subunit alpha [Nitrososphaerota archaeon]MDG6978414.1 NAD(P) transhydrogenase subunit alpha [Nitrososphaerota archaeon]